jgi:radical SAM protein with 4Fe4S-binding SPASM domain
MVGSNGVLLTNPVIREGLEKRKHLISLAITLDGPKEMHDLCRFTTTGAGSFDTLMSIWPWFKKNFPANADNTKSTISHDNLKHITSVAKFFWEEMDVGEILMNCVFENVWWKGDQLVLFDQLCNLADYLLEDKRYERYYVRWFDTSMGRKDVECQKWCGAGTNMDAVAYDGTIYPCLRFKTTDRRPPIPLGTVDTWKDPTVLKSFDVANCHLSGDSVQKQITGVDCGVCPISSLCSSCQAWSYDVHGRLDVKAIFICPMHKAAVFANYYLFGQLLGIFSKNDRYYLMDLLDQYTANDYFGYDELGNPIPEPWAQKETL